MRKQKKLPPSVFVRRIWARSRGVAESRDEVRRRAWEREMVWEAEIRVVKPRIMVCLGSVAAQAQCASLTCLGYS